MSNDVRIHSARGIATSDATEWYTPRTKIPPMGVKLNLLHRGGTSGQGPWSWDSGLIAWAPLQSVPPEVAFYRKLAGRWAHMADWKGYWHPSPVDASWALYNLHEPLAVPPNLASELNAKMTVRYQRRGIAVFEGSALAGRFSVEENPREEYDVLRLGADKVFPKLWKVLVHSGALRASPTLPIFVVKSIDMDLLDSMSTHLGTHALEASPDRPLYLHFSGGTPTGFVEAYWCDTLVTKNGSVLDFIEDVSSAYSALVA